MSDALAAPPMSIAAKFLWGFVGSAAMEVITLYQLYESTNLDDPTKSVLPARYKRIGFWLVRLTLALMAGGLAVVQDVTTPILAVNVGAATPLILQALAQGLKNTLPSGVSAGAAQTANEAQR
jgi:hypothetical protein